MRTCVAYEGKMQEEAEVQLMYLNLLWNEEKVRRLYDER